MIFKTSSALHSLLLLSALAASGCHTQSDIDSSAAAVESSLCGVDGRMVYDSDCADLAAECVGDFLCYDEEPARDGSCLTWGECVSGEGLAGVEPDEIDAPAAAGVEPDEIDAPAATGVEPDEIDAPAATGVEPDEIDAPAATGVEPDEIDAQ